MNPEVLNPQINMIYFVFSTSSESGSNRFASPTADYDLERLIVIHDRKNNNTLRNICASSGFKSLKKELGSQACVIYCSQLNVVIISALLFIFHSTDQFHR